jgi:diacylglycerol kinase (ATP)
VRELVFIVNAASGGRRGRWLLEHLRTMFGVERVHPFDGGSLDGVIADCAARGRAAVACGGDGTVAAILSASHRQGNEVPIGIVPLGTGNDLARTLGWFTAGDLVLSSLRTATVRRIDRWLWSGAGRERAWFNYCSIGFDARVAQRFHAMRRQHSYLFRAALLNKALYGVASLGEGGGSIAAALRVSAAQPIAVPPWAGALVLANIPSYAGGARLGPAIVPDDGRLDAFALPPGLALGLAVGGMRQARRLDAHRHLAIEIKRPLAMQIDGEPMIAPPGRYDVRSGGSVAVLAPA